MHSPFNLFSRLRYGIYVVFVLLAVLVAGVVWVAVAQAAPVAQQIYVPLLAGPGPASQPLTVVPQPDNGRASSATIPLAGGEIVATAANGTRFTLSIPAGAMFQTTTITLTPVVQIGGLPDVQLVGAVELAPRNLLLFQAATLRVEAAQALPAAQEYPFAYYGAGQDFHPYPILPYEETPTFPITQFNGGYGLAQANPPADEQAAVATVASTPDFAPADPAAQLSSQIAALIQAERVRVLQGQEPDPTLWDKIAVLSLEYYNQVIVPILQRSPTDCDFAEANMGKALGWLRNIQLMFGDTADSNADFAAAGEAILDALVASIKNCYLKAAEPCLDWGDPAQVAEVLRYYRSLLLLGSAGGVPEPNDLPECVVVDVTLQGGAFRYEFPRDAESGWRGTTRFRFVDDSVSGVGFHNPFLPTGTPVDGPKATYTITAKIDDVWQPVDYLQRFFCRDQRAQRVQELAFTYTRIEGEPEAPPQLYADNIGCWRWTGSVRYDIDYDNLGASVPVYTIQRSGDITLERDATRGYVPYMTTDQDTGQQVMVAQQQKYDILSPGMVRYDERLEHVVDGERTCLQTLTLNITDPASYIDSRFPALSLPNAGFTLPREAQESLGSELEVNAPYTTQGTTCPREGDELDVFSLPIAGDLSADGKRIQLNETGSTGEQTGTYEIEVDLRALRE